MQKWNFHEHVLKTSTIKFIAQFHKLLKKTSFWCKLSVFFPLKRNVRKTSWSGGFYKTFLKLTNAPLNYIHKTFIHPRPLAILVIFRIIWIFLYIEVDFTRDVSEIYWWKESAWVLVFLIMVGYMLLSRDKIHRVLLYQMVDKELLEIMQKRHISDNLFIMIFFFISKSNFSFYTTSTALNPNKQELIRDTCNFIWVNPS